MIFGASVSRHVYIFGLAVLAICLLRFVFFYFNFVQFPDMVFDPDSWDYTVPANYLLEFGEFRENEIAFTWRRTPGYPMFLAINYFLFGAGNHLSSVVIQNFVFVGSVFIVGYLAKKLGGWLAAYIAAGLYLLDFTSFYYTNVLLTETLFTFLVLLVVLLLSKAFDGKVPRYGMLMSAGFVLTVATYIRPASLYYFLVAAFFAGALTFYKTQKWRPIFLSIGLVILPWIVLGGSWYMRNLDKFDQFKFTTQQVDILDLRSSNMIADIEGRVLGDVRAYYPKYLDGDANLISTHVRFYFNEFGVYVKLSLFSAARTLLNPGQWHLEKYFQNYHKDRRALQNLILNGEFGALFAELMSRDWWMNVLLLFLLGHTAVLLGGCFLTPIVRPAFTEAQWPVALFAMGNIAYFLFLVMVWDGQVRFRVPFTPYLAVFSGVGYTCAWRLLWNRFKQ